MADVAKQFSGWCAPSVLYLILVAIGTFMLYRSTSVVPTPAGWSYLWAYLLINLGFFFLIFSACQQGQTRTAWVLFFIPIIIYVIFWAIGYASRPY